MDKLTSINVFRQVVESGSFMGAADRLDLSTAMVSKHVMAIEKRLRVRLLNRNSHKLSLTEPGTFYLERIGEDVPREIDNYTRSDLTLMRDVVTITFLDCRSVCRDHDLYYGLGDAAGEIDERRVELPQGVRSM